MAQKSVLIGISGGIDSAVAAAILMEQGFRTEGLYIRNGFPTRAEVEAERVAEELDMPLHIIDLTNQFGNDIVEYFASEYAAGRTPNPCIVCNKKIKFRYLIEEAEKRGIDYLATGHYARREERGGEKGFRLLRGVDTNKDQSYFLFELGQEELERTIFPNGEMTKDEIREKARGLDLGAFSERESQEICFIPDNDYRRFIEDFLVPSPFEPGNIVDNNGSIVGRHRGIHTVTIGQRKGLNIASERPYYVTEIDGKKNRVIVGRDEDQYFTGLIAERVSWNSSSHSREKSLTASTQIRYRHKGVDSIITHMPDRKDSVSVVFDTPQKAVAPGQAAVFYQGAAVIGGGWISKGVRRG
ncbi:MAG: tRNA 2-thiouridine(34) synthase MnmA [Deltaproteobacteria bacterium]|nr:tRNA 2-thiouridine(34) synthase MnmA [Deltaproteobacteria bacterium]